MAWVRLDDLAPEHPKFVAVGPLGLALFVAGLAFCNRQLTDGAIPAAIVPRLQAIDDAIAVADSLVTAGLWKRAAGGDYTVHDYLTYQPSRTKVLGERDANAARMRSNRKGAANVR